MTRGLARRLGRCVPPGLAAPAVATWLASGLLAAGLLAALVAAPTQAQERARLEGPRRIWVARGSFLRGSTEADVEAAIAECRRRLPARLQRVCAPRIFQLESPQRTIVVSAYGIDRTEVTRDAWRRCMDAGACPPPRGPAPPGPAPGRHPVTGVTNHEAAAFCRFAGGRLPTEAEWERAARGPDGRSYPWGRLFNDRLANHGGLGGRAVLDGFRGTAPVGSFPGGASPHGLADMAGNVWEWVADRFDAGSYATGRAVDPRGPRSGGERLIRGGSHRVDGEQLRTAHRLPLAAGRAERDVGFRCAYAARPPGFGLGPGDTPLRR